MRVSIGSLLWYCLGPSNSQKVGDFHLDSNSKK